MDNQSSRVTVSFSRGLHMDCSFVMSFPKYHVQLNKKSLNSLGVTEFMTSHTPKDIRQDSLHHGVIAA